MKTKHYITVFALAMTAFFTSCSSLKNVGDNKKIDTQLVGTWGGEETDQQIEGFYKKWKMIRNGDGTFSIDFFAQKGDFIKEYVEKGNWWVEGDLFYEYHETSNKTDIYKYKVIDKNNVQFILSDSEMEFNVDNYTFIDKRLPKRAKEAVIKGTTIETAIKVNSVTEEYDYLKKHYPNSKFIGQALISQGEYKYYDKLTFKTKEGETLSLYFDITSFFGKGF